VIELQVDGMPEANQRLTQQPDGSVTLNGQFAQLGPNSMMKIGNRGVTTNWTDATERLSWEFDLYRAGKYSVLARAAAARVAGVWTDPTSMSYQKLELQLEAKLSSKSCATKRRAQIHAIPCFPIRNPSSVKSPCRQANTG
jgi:hypothetical protein